MRLVTLAALALAVPAVAGGQPANPLTGGARLNYGIIKDFVTRAAAKMPDEHYPFAPTSDIRSFARLVGHLADALAGSFAFCDKQYAEMTDATGTAIVSFDAGGEGNRVPIRMPRLTVLAFHVQHAFEHYGNIVTYMRLKGIVPPSSEPRRP
jgi:hypothetical protein